MTVHVPPAVMRGIQARQAIIDQYQHVADSLKSELAGFITKQLGVNLEDGDWSEFPNKEFWSMFMDSNPSHSPRSEWSYLRQIAADMKELKVAVADLRGEPSQA